MLYLALLLSLLETSFAFDFPLPFETEPQVAFQPRKLSKYFDLDRREWRDSNEGCKFSYNNMLLFCQDRYPDSGVTYVHQGSQRTLEFCSKNDKTKCSDKDTITWSCATESPTGTPGTPASSPSYHVIKSCTNETTRKIQYDICTPIEHVLDRNYCADHNQTMAKMDKVKQCNMSREEGAANAANGLISADLQCCSKSDNIYYSPGTITIPRTINPFNPFNPGQETVVKPDVVLPLEWCDLEGVEKKRENMTAENIALMQTIYQVNKTDNIDELVRQIKTVESTLNKEVVELYSDHYSCLIATVETDVAGCLEVFNKLCEMESLKLLSERGKELIRADIEAVSTSLGEVNSTFASMCSEMVTGTMANDFTNEYRTVVIRLQELRQKIAQVMHHLAELENCVDCTSEPPVITQNNVISPHDTKPGPTIDEPMNNGESKLRNQKYLIVIVSTVASFTILGALIFFIIVVRRTSERTSHDTLPTTPPATF